MIKFSNFKITNILFSIIVMLNVSFVVFQEESFAQQQKQENNLAAEEIIKKAIKAIGPQEKLEKVSGFKMRATIYSPNGDLIATYSVILKRPDYFESSSHSGSGKDFVIVYDKEEITVIKNKQKIEDGLYLTKQKEKAKSILRYAPFGFYYFFKEGCKYDLLKDASVEGVDCYVVEFYKDAETKEQFFIDKKDFLIKRSITIKLPNDDSQATENNFYDYRDIEGILFPFLSKQCSNGKIIASTEVEWIGFLN